MSSDESRTGHTQAIYTEPAASPNGMSDKPTELKFLQADTAVRPQTAQVPFALVRPASVGPTSSRISRGGMGSASSGCQRSHCFVARRLIF
jgi:hypothetical protein